MSYSAEVLADTPSVYWRLGDASGTTMTDSSGNSRNGTYSNAPTLGAAGALAGDADTAVTFSGAGAQAAFIAFSSWMSQSSFTLEAWVKGTGTGRIIFGRGGTSTVGYLGVDVNGKLFIQSLTTGAVNQNRVSLTSINDNAWHHVVGVRDGTALHVYVDGVLNDGATAGTAGAVAADTTNSLNVASRGGGTPNLYAGTIDECAFYPVALTSTRIAAHYAAGTSTSSSASGTGSLSLSASGAAQAAATGSASLSLSASGSSSSAATGSGSLSLSGSVASSAVAATGSGALSLSAGGTSSAATVGAGSLSLSATGAAGSVSSASGSGSLTLSGSSTSSVAAVGSGSLVLSGSGDTSVVATGAGSLVLSGSATATSSVAATGSGSLTLGAFQASPASGAGSLTLSATGAAEALYLTDTSNLLNGRVRRARGTSTVDHPASSTPSRVAVRYDKSVPYPPPTLVNGRPT